MIKITTAEFSLVSRYIHDLSGIWLEPGKEYLVETRLHPLLEELQCRSYTEFIQRSRADASKQTARKLIDAISTNETYFFRDASPFDLLAHKVLPDLIDRRTGGKQPTRSIPIRIWSAASSTGQEIYSIAMIVRELNLDPRFFSVKLLGTDISDAAVARASYGKFNKFEATRGLAPARLQKFFEPLPDGSYRIRDEIRAMAQFKRFNLMEPFIGLGKFDIILCRNVAIYFSAEDRKKLYEKIAASLEPDGYLLVGSTESISGDTSLFEPKRYLRSVFYQFRK